MTSKVEISHRTIIFAVLFVVSLWLLVQVRDILFLIFIAFIIMAGLRPLVDGLERFKIPRVMATLIIYFATIGIFGFSFAQAIPSLIYQSTKFLTELPSVISRALPYWNIDPSAITQQIAPISENILRVTIGIFSNVVTTITVLVLAFYLLLERKHTEEISEDIMGKDAATRTFTVLQKIESRIGAWIRGQLILMIVIGVMTYIGLTILHMDFVLPLSIIAGLLEIVPMIGPMLSAVPAVLVAYAISPLLALSVIALYFIVQQFENHVVVPMVMRRSVGLSPFVTIVILMIGGRLGGIVGAVLAVPVFLVGQVIVSDVLSKSS